MRAVAILLVLAVVAVVVLYALGILGGEDALRVHVAVDISHSKPILALFQERTGIELDIQYDDEASKTVGHVNTIITEQETGKPRADVFWNNEIAHTIRLKAKGYLQPYVSPNAAEIPALFKDAEGYWTGFAARARIFIVNTDEIPDEAKRPTSMADLAKPEWRGKCTLARPETGTTLTHVATLFNEEVLGATKAEAFLTSLMGGQIDWLPSNGATMRAVRDGSLAFGFTDTDDYNKALSEGKPVVAVYPDQGEGQLGTLVIPNTVSIIKDAPHAEDAKKLVDFLLSKEVEELLAKGASRQIPVRPDVPVPDDVKVPGKDFRAMTVDWTDVGMNLEARYEEIRRILKLK